ncbi:hypothetical protein GF357_04010 [Candidatus Dojkabacteria bacterium]|nr:hypothetical protein [Candidatus Dojkabacteria bacterium]
MYHQYTPQENKKTHGLPNDYSISGILTVGTYTPQKWIQILDNHLDAKSLKYSKTPLQGFLRQITQYCIEDEFKFWFMPTLGSAELASAVHLGCQCGSQQNIHLGSCGGLDPKLEDYTTIIPMATYDSGTSAVMYSPDRQAGEFQSDPELSKKLLKAAKASDLNCVKGRIMTCQAMYAQTQKDILNWSKQGYSGVEMETATLFAISNHFNVPAGALIYITDNLVKGDTVFAQKHESSSEFRHSIKKRFVAIACEFLGC